MTKTHNVRKRLKGEVFIISTAYRRSSPNFTVRKKPTPRESSGSVIDYRCGVWALKIEYCKSLSFFAATFTYYIHLHSHNKFMGCVKFISNKA